MRLADEECDILRNRLDQAEENRKNIGLWFMTGTIRALLDEVKEYRDRQID